MPNTTVDQTALVRLVETAIVIPNNIFFQKVFKRRLGTHTTGLGDQLRQHHAGEDSAPGTFS